MSACGVIRQIVRLRQLLRRWRKRTAAGCCSTRRMPSDVPCGHVAVRVGPNRRRYVLRTTYLNHPSFRNLLAQTEEEFGFTNSGPLVIPCDESLFEEVLRLLSRSDSGFTPNPEDLQSQRRCREEFVRINMGLDSWADSRPLLRGLSADKPVW